MTIKVGDTVPQGAFTTFTADGPRPMTTDELFKGKTVAFFAVPGAFTPTCSARHLPSFKDHAAKLKAKGVDVIACASVNDVFVMKAWGEHQNVGGVQVARHLAARLARHRKNLDLRHGAPCKAHGLLHQIETFVGNSRIVGE